MASILPQSNVPAQRKRHGVHKLCRIRYEGKQAESEELLVDARALQDDIHDVDQNF